MGISHSCPAQAGSEFSLISSKTPDGGVFFLRGVVGADPARSPDPEPEARAGGARWRELEDAPLTATTKGDLSSSRRGTVQGSKRERNSQLQRLLSRSFSTRFG